MKITEAKFLMSNTNVAKCPQTGLPEFAFIGRSNVGKSSLINMLLQSPGLAKTSSKPGKTLLINHFVVNDRWYAVDLPGYGYARISKDERVKLKNIIDSYVLHRDALTCLFLLLDSRLEPQQIDLDFITFLGENGVPFAIIFTKCDKLGPVRLQENIKHYKDVLAEQWETLPPIFITSSEKRVGRDEVLDFVEQYI